MSASHENARLEAFCDGVFAIAITLLILEIKVPPVESIHSNHGFWIAVFRLWPSFLAFVLSFVIILIAWFNHHGSFKFIDGYSHPFLFANGFFLMTIVILPFPTALISEYISTNNPQPAIFLFCLSTLVHNLSWILFYYTTLKPNPLATKPESIVALKQGLKLSKYGFVIYAIIALLAWWFPYFSLCVTIALLGLWTYMGITYKIEKMTGTTT